MKRNLIGTLSLVVMSLLLSATGAFAQSAVSANVPFAFQVGQAQLPAGSYQIQAGYQSLIVSGQGQANVPFAFKVGKTQLPAGTYRIKAVSQSLTEISNGQTMKPIYSQVQWQGPSKTSAKLVFHHLGNQYFLAEIWRGAGNAAMAIPASKLEKELQMASGPSTTGREVAIALH